MALARYHIGRFLHHAYDVRMPDDKICRCRKKWCETQLLMPIGTQLSTKGSSLFGIACYLIIGSRPKSRLRIPLTSRMMSKQKVDESGKVLGKDSTHIEIRYRDSKELSKVRDSLIHYKEIAERASIYKAQRDSLNRELSIAQTKKEYIEKDLEGWDLFYWKLVMISFWVVSLMLVTMIFFLTVKYKKKLFY